jgi:hypothetical protein
MRRSSTRSASGLWNGCEDLDRHHGARSRAGVPAADRAPARARGRGRDHVPRLRADGAAARAPRNRRRDPRPPRRSVTLRQDTLAPFANARVALVGPRQELRRSARARLARADADRAPARHSKRDDVRLRVRLAPAPARLPGGDAGRGPRRDSARAAGALWSRAVQARAVPRAEGGVLPRRLRARPVGARRLGDRPRSDAGRRPHAPGRLALPPPFEPALPAGTRPSRPERVRARDRAAAHAGAGRLRAQSRAAVGARPGTGSRRAKSDCAGRPRRLCRGQSPSACRSTRPTAGASAASTRG